MDYRLIRAKISSEKCFCRGCRYYRVKKDCKMSFSFLTCRKYGSFCYNHIDKCSRLRKRIYRFLRGKDGKNNTSN